MTYSDLAAVELRETAGGHVKQTLEQGGTVFEWRHRRKDGSELPVEISTTPFVAQGEQRIMATIRDLTLSKAAEEALQQSEERFKSLASMATEGIMVHKDDVILDANRAFAELCGYHDGDELIGKVGLEVLPATEESRQDLIRHIRAAHGATLTVELVGKDGARTWAETRGREVMYRGRRLAWSLRATSPSASSQRKRYAEANTNSARCSKPHRWASARPICRAGSWPSTTPCSTPGGYSREDIQAIGNVAALYYDPGERETALALFHGPGLPAPVRDAVQAQGRHARMTCGSRSPAPPSTESPASKP